MRSTSGWRAVGGEDSGRARRWRRVARMAERARVGEARVLAVAWRRRSARPSAPQAGGVCAGRCGRCQSLRPGTHGRLPPMAGWGVGRIGPGGQFGRPIWPREAFRPEPLAPMFRARAGCVRKKAARLCCGAFFACSGALRQGRRHCPLRFRSVRGQGALRALGGGGHPSASQGALLFKGASLGDPEPGGRVPYPG